MSDGYERLALEDVDPEPGRPSRRWPISSELGLEDYNLNVARLDPGARLSTNAYHYHEDQEEFYYVLEGSVRVETEDGGFDLGPDEMAVFRPGVNHLLHNRSDAPVKLIAIGSPPEGRYPVHSVQSHEALLEERYDEAAESEGGDEAG